MLNLNFVNHATKIEYPETDDNDDKKTECLFPNSELNDFEELYQNTQQNFNDFQSWELLFVSIEKSVQELVKSNKIKSCSSEFKFFLRKCYKKILNFYPYLVTYWKNWINFEEQVEGKDACLKLSLISVQRYKTSIELWTNYLSRLIKKFQTDKEKKDSDLEFINLRIKEALSYNSYHFLSHELWDLVLNFKYELNGYLKELLDLWIKVVKIPLYHYSQYSNKFIDIIENYKISDVINKEDLNIYLVKFQRETPDDFSPIEKKQIYDAFLYKKCLSTQKEVMEKWKFESSFSIKFFSPQNQYNSDKEISNWISYLNHDIEKYNNSNVHDEFRYEIVLSLFQRCLVIFCFNFDLWFKYLSFINNSKLSEEEKFETCKNIYSYSIENFVPLNETRLKFSYVLFLIKNKQFDKGITYLLDLIKIFSRKENKSTIYLKKQYLESFQILLRLWRTKVLDQVFIEITRKFIYDYFNKQETEQNEQNMEKVTTEAGEIDKATLKTIFFLLNNDSICVVINEYLQTSFKKKNKETRYVLRKFYNEFYKEDALKNSVKFWDFFLKFEGITYCNLENMIKILNYVKNEINIPKIIIDEFIEFAYDVLSANILLINHKTLKNLIVTKDTEKSDSLIHNKSLLNRFSNNNHVTKKKQDNKSQKTSNNVHSNHNQTTKNEKALKYFRCQISHPGISIESTPEITNKGLSVDNWSLLNSNLIIPPLPNFKNVEKAGSHVNYIL